ncbi:MULTISPECIES: hypothetical protein [unclassified Paenibacillus]|uniref:hypothetical protein n=1 Tax=unclassified Paenibacillus TaxID=185978 RepID=UPI00362810E4
MSKTRTLEETGYEIYIGSCIGKAQRYFISPQNEPLLSNGIFFLAEFIKKVQEPMDDDHHLKWINLKEVDTIFFHEHQSWAIKKAITILGQPMINKLGNKVGEGGCTEVIEWDNDSKM